MGQLIFNDEFNNIVNEPLPYWKTSDDIPKHIRSYILDEVSKLRLIGYDNDHCSNCLGELNDDFTCNQCGTKYDNNSSQILFYEKLKEDIYSSVIVHFYVYDIINTEVILYQIDVLLYYHNPFISGIKKTTSLLITRAFHVQKDKCIDLVNNKIIQYKNFNDINCDIEYKSDNDNIRLLYRYADDSFEYILYPDNLDCLKDTIYRYSHIWDLKNSIIVKYRDIPLESLILYPIYYPQFEYLVKMKLYNLALLSADKFTKGKTFQEVFGVSSDYLSFMQRMDICYEELDVLRLCKKKDLSLINFFVVSLSSYKKLLKLGINVNKVVQYFEDNNIEAYNIVDYIDYIECAAKLGLNLKDKNVLFPINFMEEHDRLYLQIEILNNPGINNKIRELSNILKFNYYEDNKYIIFPAETLESMIDEGIQQHNCLRTYIVEYSDNDCQIYFMREKDKKAESLVTIEVRGCKIVQARTRFNKLPNDEIMQILRKWERTLLPIENED